MVIVNLFIVSVRFQNYELKKFHYIEDLNSGNQIKISD